MPAQLRQLKRGQGGKGLLLSHQQQGGGGCAPARSSRRASQPPFWRIFQLDRAVRPPSPRLTPPENTTKWVFQSKKPASRRASQPPFWRIFQLDRAVGPPSPCSSSSTFAHQAQKKNTQPLGRPTTFVGPGSWSLGGEWTNYIGLPSSSIQILDHFSMATPSPQQCLVLQPFLSPPPQPQFRNHTYTA